MLQWESPGTTKARELSDVYRILDCEEDLEGPDRVPGLFALRTLVSHFQLYFENVNKVLYYSWPH